MVTISISQRKAISGGVKPGGNDSAMLVVIEGQIEPRGVLRSSPDEADLRQVMNSKINRVRGLALTRGLQAFKVYCTAVYCFDLLIA